MSGMGVAVEDNMRLLTGIGADDQVQLRWGECRTAGCDGDLCIGMTLSRVSQLAHRGQCLGRWVAVEGRQGKDQGVWTHLSDSGVQVPARDSMAQDHDSAVIGDLLRRSMPPLERSARPA